MSGAGRGGLFQYERRGRPLIGFRSFLVRLAHHGGLAIALIAASLLLGAAGYRWTEGMGWTDAFLNAAMILAGMGPVDRLATEGGKLFATFYALFSGVVFLVAVGVLLAPALHRVLHRFHLDEGDPDS